MASEGNNAFKWDGINALGKRTNGIVKATSKKEAYQELKKMSIDIISVTEHRGLAFISSQKKIKVKDIQLFTRYLSTMLASGLPILQALDLVGQDQENPSMKALIVQIKTDISGGKTLAETFRTHPEHFNDLYCSLIGAGEKSGSIDKILSSLASYMEKTESLKRKIKKAMTYPIAVLTVAMIVSLVLLMFVVPQFQTMFASFGAKLPFFTQLVVMFSNFLRSYWWVGILTVMCLSMWWRYILSRNQLVLSAIDRGVLKIPVVGVVLVKGIIARFTRTLATTLQAGMPITDSLATLTPVMGNRIYIKAIQKITTDVTSGHTLSAAMSSSKIFPNMVVQMIAIGEASGKLPDMLNKIAEYYEEEVNLVVDNLSSLIEPLIMLILGGIVGTFVVAMYLPIFKMGSLF